MIVLAAAMLLSAVPGTVLVLPPDAPAERPEAWVAELVADQLPRSLAFLGVPAIERAERRQAHAALEIPLVPLTRATSIRMAEALGASRIVTGEYAVDTAGLAVTLRVLDVQRGVLGAPLVARGPLESAADMVDNLAWDIALSFGTLPSHTRDELFALRNGVGFEAVKTHAQGLAARGAAARIRTVRRALTLAPGFHAARLSLGRLLLEQREFSAAYETLARIPADVPVWRSARFVQGVALLEVGRYREAVALYAGLAGKGATPAALNNRALAMLRDGDRATRASDVLQQAVQLSPDSIDLAFNLGWSLLVEGAAEAASGVLGDVANRAPLDRHTRLLLAWSLGLAGRAAEQEEAWRAVAALAPGFETQTRPDLTRRFERIRASERAFEAERETRSRTELAASLLARAQRLHDSADTEGAMKEVARAAYLDPANRRVNLLKARLHRLRRDHESALSDFRVFLWANDDPVVRTEVALLLREMGRPAEARAEAEKALKTDPANEQARKLLDSL
jgi:tetratricopeptide (TPR) repeat protein